MTMNDEAMRNELSTIQTQANQTTNEVSHRTLLIKVEIEKRQNWEENIELCQIELIGNLCEM